MGKPQRVKKGSAQEEMVSQRQEWVGKQIEEMKEQIVWEVAKDSRDQKQK